MLSKEDIKLLESYSIGVDDDLLIDGRDWIKIKAGEIDE